MSPIFASTEPPRPPAPATIACPVCGGPLFEMREMNRCARCQYVICQNCDGEQAGPVEADGGGW